MNEEAGRAFWNRVDGQLDNLNENLTTLCEKTKTSYKNVSMQRTRHTIPKIEQLLSFADFLNTSVEYLVTGMAKDKPVSFTPRVTAIARACERTTEKNLRLIESILDLDIEGKNNPIPTAG